MNEVATTPDKATVDALEARNATLTQQVNELTRQLEWFKRQLFGRKSEKRLEIDPAVQPLLDGLVDAQSTTTSSIPPTETVTYERRKKQRDAGCVTDAGLRFDDSVPVVTITLPVPADIGAYEVIGEVLTHRLAQRAARGALRGVEVRASGDQAQNRCSDVLVVGGVGGQFS